MARTRRVTRRPRRARQGIFEALLEGAGDIVGSVAKEVVPQVVAVIDMNGVVQEIDVQALLERIDLNALLEGMDVNALLARVDLDAILEKADLDRLLARLDIQVLVDRLDIGEIIAKVDVNAVLEQVDIDALVERTEIGSLIARSGAGVFGKVLDVARSQGVGLDSFVHRWMDRLLRRDPSARPGCPPLLVVIVAPPATT